MSTLHHDVGALLLHAAVRAFCGLTSFVGHSQLRLARLRRIGDTRTKLRLAIASQILKISVSVNGL